MLAECDENQPSLKCIPYALTRINIRLEKPQTFTAILHSHKYLVVCILNGLFTECAMLHQSMTI